MMCVISVVFPLSPAKSDAPSFNTGQAPPPGYSRRHGGPVPTGIESTNYGNDNFLDVPLANTGTQNIPPQGNYGQGGQNAEFPLSKNPNPVGRNTEFPNPNTEFPNPVGRNTKFPNPVGRNTEFPNPVGRNTEFPNPNTEFPNPVGKNTKFPNPVGRNTEFPNPGGRNTEFPNPDGINTEFPNPGGEFPNPDGDFPNPVDRNTKFPNPGSGGGRDQSTRIANPKEQREARSVKPAFRPQFPPSHIGGPQMSTEQYTAGMPTANIFRGGRGRVQDTRPRGMFCTMYQKFFKLANFISNGSFVDNLNYYYYFSLLAKQCAKAFIKYFTHFAKVLFLKTSVTCLCAVYRVTLKMTS